MEIRNRIKKVVKWLIGEGYADNQKGVGCLLGYTNESAFSQVLNGHVDLPADFIPHICALDDRLNMTWLLTGDGEMLKSNTLAQAGPDAGYRLVPMFNLDARGGLTENDVVDTPEYIVDRIPFKDAEAADICVPISGNSMAPTYCAGSIVLLHQVERWSDFLELGQVYMIILKDGRRLIKELRASEEDRKTKYLCVSHNPTFDPVELPKEMISRVFLVRAVYAKTAM